MNFMIIPNYYVINHHILPKKEKVLEIRHIMTSLVA